MKKKNSKSKTLINVSHPDIITGVQGPTKIFKVFDIRYDTDGRRVAGLPKELFFQVDADIDPNVDRGDHISNHPGWCQYGYNAEVVTESPVPANAGYTLIELLICIFVIFMVIIVLAAIVVGGYAAYHFIGKYW